MWAAGTHGSPSQASVNNELSATCSSLSKACPGLQPPAHKDKLRGCHPPSPSGTHETSELYHIAWPSYVTLTKHLASADCFLLIQPYGQHSGPRSLCGLTPHPSTELTDDSLQTRKPRLKETGSCAPQVRKPVPGSAKDVGVHGA